MRYLKTEQNLVDTSMLVLPAWKFCPLLCYYLTKTFNYNKLYAYMILKPSPATIGPYNVASDKISN